MMDAGKKDLDHDFIGLFIENPRLLPAGPGWQLDTAKASVGRNYSEEENRQRGTFVAHSVTKSLDSKDMSQFSLSRRH
jgi:hypothetical protein